jgi:hypothetical protein
VFGRTNIGAALNKKIGAVACPVKLGFAPSGRRIACYGKAEKLKSSTRAAEISLSSIAIYPTPRRNTMAIRLLFDLGINGSKSGMNG